MLLRKSLAMCCAIDAVTWYKGVRELTYSQRCRILAENDGHFMMQIPSTMKQDSGEFTITASNSIGSVKNTTIVTILPPRPGATPSADVDWLASYKRISGLMARGEDIVPPVNFRLSESCQKIFFSYKKLSQKCKMPG